MASDHVNADVHSTTSSSDDDSMDDIQIDDKDMKLLMDLEASLEANPHVYETHVEFIAVLRRCKMMERLRDARRNMHQHFPLSERMWLEWLEDESSTAATVEDVRSLERLLQESHGDYLSVSLWKEHLQVLQAMLQQGGATLVDVRQAYDQALEQCGLHMTEGHTIWDMCIEFEISLDSPSKDDERIRRVFHQYLATPFPPDVLMAAKESYISWIGSSESEEDGDGVPKNMMKAIERAQRAYELREECEKNIETAKASDPGSNTHLSAYMSYIDLEISGGVDERIRVVFERAISEFPVADVLWKDYLKYLEFAAQPHLLNACERALRNCPYSGALWSVYVRSLSKKNEAVPDKAVYEELNAAFEQGKASLQHSPHEYRQLVLSMAHSLRLAGDIYKSQYEELLQKSIKEMNKQQALDPEHRLTSLLVVSMGDLEKGKLVWESLLVDSSIDAAYSGTWVSYYDYLTRHGDSFETRRDVFVRAMGASMSEGDKAFIARKWIALEEEEGSQSSYLEAQRTVFHVLWKEDLLRMGMLHGKQSPLDADAAKKKRQQNDPNYGAGKRKRQEQPVSSPQNKKQKPQQQHGKLIVFVKHIVPTATEEDLMSLFSDCGSQIDITIGRDPKTNRSKGYAYIRCGDQEVFDNVCAKNGLEFEGNALFIAPSAPPKGRNKDKGRDKQGNHGDASTKKERSQKPRLEPAAPMIPRAAAIGAPKSNDDFRKMFLKK
ncbi:hypothetical protein M9435_005544 [Picochlorum sp. BPE23]|nr:hypothetical protein M9435_005544 [Picochlorum sp. BPE23]